MEGTKFQLQPSRLYPNIHTEHGNLTVSENQDFNAKRTKPCVSEERCRQPISNKKSNLDGNNALNYHKGTQEKAKKLDYNSTLLRTCKFVIKLFFIIVVILSLILNIYLLSNKGNWSYMIADANRHLFIHQIFFHSDSLTWTDILWTVMLVRQNFCLLKEFCSFPIIRLHWCYMAQFQMCVMVCLKDYTIIW